jgi:elongator complex protein 3
MIKIYPTLLVEGTELYDQWKSGDYSCLTTKKATELIAQMKEYVPEWVRIQRIQRDIPATYISSGIKKSNLRQIVEKEMKNHGKKCRCIRCREVGHKSLKEPISINDEDIEFSLCQYKASNSTEIFISLEDKKQDFIIGYLRLRDIVGSHRYELSKIPCMIIRELKILGLELPIGNKTKTGLQHKGYGKELIDETERICFEDFDKKKLFVLSGIGVKEYYRKLGFFDDGIYLSKRLKS